MSNSWLPPRSGTDLQPLQSSSSSAHPSKPETPEQRQAKWNASLGDGFALTRNGAAARQLFEEVANGFAQPDDARQAQAVFNDLIEHEMYDTFVEVFNAYSAVRAAQVCTPGEQPFKATLTLQLPQGWNPSGSNAFIQALGRVKVERLEVVRPQSPVYDVGVCAEELCVPEAVCEGIAELLSNGTAELVVRGVLAKSGAVSLAMAMSTCKLRSLELGEEIGNTELTDFEKQSYEDLMDGVLHSNTLRHLSISQPGLVKLREKLDALAQHNAPVESIGLVAVAVHPPNASEDLGLFVKSVKAFKALTSFSLKCNALPGRVLVGCVLGPLRKHSTLVQLDILAPATGFHGFADMGVAPELMNFASTCPSLRHVKLRGIPLTGRAGSSITLGIGGMSGYAAQAEEEFARHRILHLESLTMIGVVLTPDFTSTFSEVLAANDTLVHLNLSGCNLSATMPLDFPSVFANHNKIRNCTFPRETDRYYFAYGERFYDISPQSGLRPNNLASPVEMASAREYFAKLSANFSEAPTATQAMLDEKHRGMANEALALDVGGLLQMVSKLPTTAFDDIAKGVLPYLAGASDAKALREVVHLSEVGKVADVHRLHADGRTPESLKVVVAAANADAVSRGLPTAPLEVNTVDVQHRNKQLRDAIQKDDALAVHAATQAGAINFGGRNTRDVRSRAVLEALHPGITNTPVATTTSTAAATSTVTAATSRTTTNTTATTTTADTSFIPPSEGGAGSPKRG